MASNRCHMRRSIGRSADGCVDTDNVVKGRAGHDVGGAEVLVYNLHSALARGIGHLRALFIRAGDRGASGQAHAEGFGQTVHGRGRAHRIAMTNRGCRRADTVHELVIVDFARTQHPAAFPDHGARPGQLAAPMSVEHRATREHNRGNIHRRRAHQHGRGGLVASGGQHHAVERIAMQDFDKAEIREVSVQRRRGALTGLLDWMDGEFNGHPSGIANTVAHPLRQLDMMAVAGGKIAACLSNADDRTPALNFVARQAIVEIPLDIKRRHARIVRVVEPFLTPQGFLRFFGHGRSSVPFSQAGAKGSMAEGNDVLPCKTIRGLLF